MNTLVKKLITSKFKCIHKYFTKLETDFDWAYLYQALQETKRLRAFLRLISYQHPPENELKLPIEIKTVYGYMGIMRDLHWLIQKIKASDVKQKQAQTIITQLENELLTWKSKLLAEFSHNPLPDAEEKIIAQLPPTIHQHDVEQFFLSKIDKVKALIEISRKDDAILEHIRKNLRDVLYNIDNLKEEMEASLPVFLWDADLKYKMEAMARKLELFDDLYTGIHFLEPQHFDSFRPIELTAIKHLSQVLKTQKEQMKSSLILELSELDFNQLPTGSNADEYHNKD